MRGVRAKARLVITWTELDCGCSRSDTGSWIVNLRCADHDALIPAAFMPGALSELRNSNGGADYGPFRP